MFIILVDVICVSAINSAAFLVNVEGVKHP